jgi:hypothetical protein
MNVLSLFDGMSCGQLALRELGIPVTNYFGSEIDEHAMKITMHNFPNTKQLGDVRNVKAKDLPPIDLILAGSPCQGFSQSGLKKNLEDPRSALYFEFERLMLECKPKYFLLENVIMDSWPERVITTRLGYDPIRLCGSSFGAIRRPRLYWTNIPVKPLEEHSKQVVGDILDSEEIDNSALVWDLDVETIKTSDDYVYHFGETFLQWDNSKTPNSKQQCKRANYLSSKAMTQCTKDQNKIILADNNTMRKWSIAEIERGHCIPAGYTSCASRNQAIHALGNGWHLGPVKHILQDIGTLMKEPKFAARHIQQIQLFTDALLERQLI